MTIHDCRPEVQQFAILMEQRLRENDHKPGWKQEAILVMAHKVHEAADRFWAKMVGIVRPPYESMRERAEQAADVANYCMMVCDCMGRLRDDDQ